MLVGPPERTRQEITYKDLVRDQIKFFSRGQSPHYNPPESGTFSLAQETGRIPWWMVAFSQKPEEIDERDRFECYSAGEDGSVLKIERECLKDRHGRDFLAERLFKIEDRELKLIEIRTVVSQESHGPEGNGVFYIHTQTIDQARNGGLSVRKGVVANNVRELLNSPLNI